MFALTLCLEIAVFNQLWTIEMKYGYMISPAFGQANEAVIGCEFVVFYQQIVKRVEKLPIRLDLPVV